MNRENNQKNQRFPWYILWMIPLYILNFVLIIVFQCVFVHTQSGPLEESALYNLEHFENSEILDIYNMVEGAGWGTQSVDPAFVLYKTNANETKIVRIEWNPYVFRYGVEKETVKTVSQEKGEVDIVIKNLFGKNTATVKDGVSILSVEEVGVTKNRSYHEMIRFTVPFILMIVEYTVYRFMYRRR